MGKDSEKFGPYRRVRAIKSMTANTGALCQISVMLIRAGCTGDVLDNPKKLRFSATSVQQVKDASSYTDTVTSKLGYYYDSTVSFLTDDCGVGSYSVATGKAVIYGVGGGLWGSSEGSLYDMWSGDSIEGLAIGSIIGSGVGLAVGVKKAYDGYEIDTAQCYSS